jgi:hypothetical protein
MRIYALEYLPPKDSHSTILARPIKPYIDWVLQAPRYDGARELKTEHFENVKGQIGYCGLWCGGCAAGNGAIVEHAREFNELVRIFELEKWVPKDFDFKEFTKGLESIQAMSVCPGCQKGGGLPDCQIKDCASERKKANCGQCGQLMQCRNFKFLEKDNSTIRDGLLQLKNGDREALMQKWTQELKSKWPHYILFH